MRTKAVTSKRLFAEATLKKNRYSF